MGEYDFDLITLGAGSGGTRASRVSAQHYGAKVACVELPFGFVATDTVGGAGGTCVIRGCVPKKLLVYGSMFAEDFKDAQGFGWHIEGRPAHDWGTLLSKKGKEIERLNGVYVKLLRSAGVTLFEGRGSMVDAHTVQVELAAGGTQTITGKHILLALGGKPTKAAIPGSEYAITSDEALMLEHMPDSSIVIVGAGYISVEFASIFRGYGASVHLMYRKPLPLTGFDEECREQVAENMKLRGIVLHASTSPTRIEKGEDGLFTVHYECDGQEGSCRAGVVMFGTGRHPNTHDIGLEALGIKMNKHGGIVVDEYSRTNVPHIYAIGDVTDRLALTPVAIMEGMAFAATVFGDKPAKPVYELVPSACFVQPPLTFVGLTESAAIENLAGDLDVFVSKFRPMKYTISGREEKTIMKIIVHAETNKVVGVHVCGPDSPEMLQGVAVALKAGATKADFDATVGIHPTSAEELVTMRTRTRRVAGKGKDRP